MGARINNHLTPQQERVLILLVHGASVRETARAMGITVRTVNSHRYDIRVKLDLWEPADLIRYAVEAGLADLRRVHGNTSC